MKIRNGFVSNSSSSSFCIYGFCTDDIQSRLAANPKLKKEIYENYKADQKDWGGSIAEEGEFFGDVFDEYPEEYLEKPLGLSCYKPCYSDYTYIGESWSSIGDNETGKEFKERIEKTLKDAFGDDLECCTLEEAWRDG